MLFELYFLEVVSQTSSLSGTESPNLFGKDFVSILGYLIWIIRISELCHWIMTSSNGC